MLRFAIIFAGQVLAGSAIVDLPKPAKPAILRAASVTERDYPVSAVAKWQEGVAVARYRVATSGLVDHCEIAKSSGVDVLDLRSCEIVQKRFRYAAAKDTKGGKVAQIMMQSFEWRIFTPCNALDPNRICINLERKRPTASVN